MHEGTQRYDGPDLDAVLWLDPWPGVVAGGGLDPARTRTPRC